MEPTADEDKDRVRRFVLAGMRTACHPRVARMIASSHLRQVMELAHNAEQRSSAPLPGSSLLHNRTVRGGQGTSERSRRGSTFVGQRPFGAASTSSPRPTMGQLLEDDDSETEEGAEGRPAKRSRRRTRTSSPGRLSPQPDAPTLETPSGTTPPLKVAIPGRRIDQKVFDKLPRRLLVREGKERDISALDEKDKDWLNNAINLQFKADRTPPWLISEEKRGRCLGSLSLRRAPVVWTEGLERKRACVACKTRPCVVIEAEREQDGTEKEEGEYLLVLPGGDPELPWRNRGYWVPL
ncbi:hypothetical protein BU16DRAFT_619945, partial [Lophium mytilinum]